MQFFFVLFLIKKIYKTYKQERTQLPSSVHTYFRRIQISQGRTRKEERYSEERLYFILRGGDGLKKDAPHEMDIWIYITVSDKTKI